MDAQLTQMELQGRKEPFNFTQLETDELARFCAEHHEVLEGDFQGPGREYGDKTAKKQQALWQQICDKINSFGIARRDVVQLKRKWNGLKSEGKINIQFEQSIYFAMDSCKMLQVYN